MAKKQIRHKGWRLSPIHKLKVFFLDEKGMIAFKPVSYTDLHHLFLSVSLLWLHSQAASLFSGICTGKNPVKMQWEGFVDVNVTHFLPHSTVWFVSSTSLSSEEGLLSTWDQQPIMMMPSEAAVTPMQATKCPRPFIVWLALSTKVPVTLCNTLSNQN